MRSPSSAPASLDGARLSRLDAEIASLRTRLAAKEREQSDLAARWGRGEGYLFPAKPEHMRRHFAVERSGR